MKKLFILLALLIVAGTMVSCKEKPVVRNRPIEEPPSPTDPLTMDHLEDPKVPVEAFEEEEVDSAEESKAISQLYKLLDQGVHLERYYVGDVDTNGEGFPQALGEDSYIGVMDDLKTIGELNALWTSTFVEEGKASKAYEELLNSRLYASINGALHIKEEVGTLTPLHQGRWSQKNPQVLSLEEDKVVFQLEATLGGAKEDRELIMQKVDNRWLLDDSYFLN